MKIRIGTRGSKLALLQAQEVLQLLAHAYPEHTYEIKIIKTTGDLQQHIRLDQMNASGIFVSAIEHALLQGEIDIAVHSMKDLPAKLTLGCRLAQVAIREDARDVLVLKHVDDLHQLPQHAKLATGSKRRKYQLLAMRPDLMIQDIRGNIDTRLQLLDEGDLDGIVIAAAAMHRMGLQHRITAYFSEDEMVPAVAQGALGFEIREDDFVVAAMLKQLGDEQLTQEVFQEREFLRLMNGGCHMPIGARCHILSDRVTLLCLFGNEDGSRLIKQSYQTSLQQMEQLASLAEDDIKQRMKEV